MRIAASLLLSLCLAASNAWAGPAQDAASNGDLAALKSALAADPPLVRRPDGPLGYTLSHFAATPGHAAIVQWLLEQGADPNAKDSKGKTPLHLAARAGRQEVAALLLAKGARVNVLDVDMHAPIHDAIDVGEQEMVEWLVGKGAKLQDPMYTREAPLHWAAERAQLEIVDWLLGHGAQLEDADNERGYTPMLYALNSFRADAAMHLVRRGANVKAKSKTGLTALHSAAAMDSTELAELLLANGADINAVAGGPASGEAADCSDLTDRMLYCAHDGTPLYFAAASDNLNVARLLIAQGADINRPDECGVTPVQQAKARAMDEMYLLLKDAGAKD